MTPQTQFVKPVEIARFEDLTEKEPSGALVKGTDLVIIKYGEKVSVLYGRCLHRGALLKNGSVKGHNLVCGVHNWDYRFDTGVSEYEPSERLYKFQEIIHEGGIWIDEQEVAEFEEHDTPPAFNRDAYLGAYADTHPEETEPYTKFIKELAQNGLKNYGHHGPTVAM
ncbi:MAG: Rieske 2Fe-2S domain-containing protein, partial [Bacteroidota bacterium]